MPSLGRRRLIISALVAGLAGTASISRLFAQDDKEISVDAWMSEWMKGTKAVHNGLNLFRFSDPIYVLTRPIKWEANPGEGDFQPVKVPTGFVTDLASVPRQFWSLLRPDGSYCFAAIVHDYLYWEQKVSREKADQIFRLCMRDMKVGKITIDAIYAAVRVAGSGSWDNNAKLKASGERRLLARWPDDPVTTWDEWKKRSDVFK